MQISKDPKTQIRLSENVVIGDLFVYLFLKVQLMMSNKVFLQFIYIFKALWPFRLLFLSYKSFRKQFFLVESCLSELLFSFVACAFTLSDKWSNLRVFHRLLTIRSLQITFMRMFSEQKFARRFSNTRWFSNTRQVSAVQLTDYMCESMIYQFQTIPVTSR